MATAISWTDETWNPTVGCERCSPGCDHCYAIGVAHRAMQPAHVGLTFADPGGPFGPKQPPDWTGEVRMLPDRLDTPLHWRKPRRVFVDSMSDLFHPGVTDEFIADVFGTMGACERHTFQVLTKRPQRMARLLNQPDNWGTSDAKATVARRARGKWWAKWYMLLDSVDHENRRRSDDPPPEYRIDNRRKRSIVWSSERTSMPLGSSDLPWPPPNVWLGTSVENQRYADLRIPHLLATPAAVRFLSVEPLLGPVDLYRWLMQPWPNGGIDWVIIGGESGRGARPMEIEWAEQIVDECHQAGVPVFVKQLGTVRGGKAHHDIDTFPASLRVREFPT